MKKRVERPAFLLFGVPGGRETEVPAFAGMTPWVGELHERGLVCMSAHRDVIPA